MPAGSIPHAAGRVKEQGGGLVHGGEASLQAARAATPHKFFLSQNDKCCFYKKFWLSARISFVKTCVTILRKIFFANIALTELLAAEDAEYSLVNPLMKILTPCQPVLTWRHRN